MSVSGFDEVTASEPEKTLLESLPTHAGRNNQGRITTRHQGGGYRKLYRKIDFKRDKHGIAGKVATIEYDPNRSARIALIHYKDGEKRYILAPLGLKVGDPIESGSDAPIRIGNAIPLAHIPVGSTIHNIELTLGRGGQLVRSAGASAQLLANIGKGSVGDPRVPVDVGGGYDLVPTDDAIHDQRHPGGGSDSNDNNDHWHRSGRREVPLLIDLLRSDSRGGA